MPAITVGLLLLVIFRPKVGENGAVFFSESGPEAMHAALGLSLAAGLIIGFLAQRTRFCTMGSIRDVILMQDYHLISGVGGLLVAAFVTNLLLRKWGCGWMRSTALSKRIVK